MYTLWLLKEDAGKNVQNKEATYEILICTFSSPRVEAAVTADIDCYVKYSSGFIVSASALPYHGTSVPQPFSPQALYPKLEIRTQNSDGIKMNDAYLEKKESNRSLPYLAYLVNPRGKPPVCSGLKQNSPTEPLVQTIA